MFAGKTIEELHHEVRRVAKSKRDIVTNTRHLQIDPTGAYAKIDDEGEFRINDLTHRQIGTWAKVPATFYDRLRADHPDLLSTTLNTIFEREPADRLMRTLDGTARAFLSNRYHRIDNDVVMDMTLKTLTDTGLPLQVASAELTERRMYLKVTFPSVEAEVKTSRQLGDLVRAGIIITNSETGQGSYSVAPMAERLICLNGMVMNDLANRRTHVGRAFAERESPYTLYQDDTLQAEDTALLLKLRDTINAVASEDKFGEIVGRMERAAEDEVTGNPVKAVEVLTNQLSFDDGESAAILDNFVRGADFTRWGLCNAVTLAAHQDGTDGQPKVVTDYDRATDLEAAGGRILNLSPAEWRPIAEAA